MAGKRTIISERFHLDRVGQDPGQYEALLQENEDYALTAAELIDTDHDGERIFQKVAVVNAVELAGKELSGKKGRRNRKQGILASETETSKAAASEGEISKAAASEGEVSKAAASEGEVSEAAASEGEVSEAAASEGEVSEAAASEGEVSEAAASEGEVSETAASEGEVSETASGTEAPGAERSDTKISGTPDLEEGIWVLADGVAIGRIKPTDRLHVHNILDNYKITGLEADLHGGHYRVVRREESELKEEEADARWAADLTLYYKVHAGSGEIISEIAAAQQIAAMFASAGDRSLAGAGNGQHIAGADALSGTAAAGTLSAPGSPDPQQNSDAEGGEERWGIDTSYDTIRKEKDPAGRGLFFLLTAAVYTTFYLCFSVPGWIPSLSSGTPSINLFGLNVSGIPGYVPGAVMIIGLICNIISMFTGGGILPAVAALLYLLAGFTAPSCLLFAAIPAVLCILGALCKKKGNRIVRTVLTLAAAAAAAFLLYQHFSGNVYFEPFIGKDLTDWTSLTAFARGEALEYMGPSAINGSGTDQDGDFAYSEFETDEDGVVYYEDGVYYEDEADWYEDESDWYEDETGWYEDETDWWEYETEYLIWDETEEESETETETETETEKDGPGQTRVAGNDGNAGLN